MASKMNIIQSVTIVNEPVIVTKDGKTETYVPKEIVGHREAYAASLHLLFKHIADFHVLMIEILAEKYDIPADDMIRVCHEDTRFQNMVVNPTIHAMQYFDEKDAAKHIAVAAEPVVPAVVPVPVANPEAKPVTKKRPVIKKPSTTPSSDTIVAAVAETSVPQPEIKSEEKTISKPKKTVIKKKKALAVETSL
jgi:hypothetical protein